MLRQTPYKDRNSQPNITRTDRGTNPPYEILITLRPDHTVYGGYWELPGGKCEPGEDPDACVRRELGEELGIEVEVIGRLSDHIHTYPHATVRLNPRLCRLAPGSPRPQNLHVVDHRWCRVDRLDGYRFPEANDRVIEELRTLLGRGDALGV